MDGWRLIIVIVVACHRLVFAYLYMPSIPARQTHCPSGTVNNHNRTLQPTACMQLIAILIIIRFIINRGRTPTQPNQTKRTKQAGNEQTNKEKPFLACQPRKHTHRLGPRPSEHMHHDDLSTIHMARLGGDAPAVPWHGMQSPKWYCCMTPGPSNS